MIEDNARTSPDVELTAQQKDDNKITVTTTCASAPERFTSLADP